MHELILGGQRSGKSRAAEARASDWLGTHGHGAVLIATALPGDAEMRARIEQHQAERAQRVPGLQLAEVPHALTAAIASQSGPQRLVVVDCLLLWLTNLLMPLDGEAMDAAAWRDACEDLCEQLDAAGGPVVLVSNEIGCGVAPLSREARRFVDELGRLHQEIAARCARVTLMVAGVPLPVKRPSA